MITEKLLITCIEHALRKEGHGISPMSEIIGQPARVFTLPNTSSEFSFFAIDLTFCEDGAVVLQEANGSNGGSTGMLPTGQWLRAEHMATTAYHRGLRPGMVALLVHANRTSLLPEFYARHALFALALQQLEIGSVATRTSSDELGDADIEVVIGPLDEIENHIDCRADRMFYRGREVGFCANPNLLPALIRAGKIGSGPDSILDLDVFHEGARAVPVVLDKIHQQHLAANTGLYQLLCAECASWTDAATAIREWNDTGQAVVAKIKSGSQGVAIGFFIARQADQIETGLSRMRTESISAYGPNADTTVLPLQLFEFAKSTAYRLGSASHLWDVRVEVHVSPGSTRLIPNSMRICPGPFNPVTFDRAGVVSNLSGRKPSLEFVRNPFGIHSSGKTELAWVGVSDEQFSEAMRSCSNWCDVVLRDSLKSCSLKRREGRQSL